MLEQMCIYNICNRFLAFLASVLFFSGPEIRSTTELEQTCSALNLWERECDLKSCSNLVLTFVWSDLITCGHLKYVAWHFERVSSDCF